MKQTWNCHDLLISVYRIYSIKRRIIQYPFDIFDDEFIEGSQLQENGFFFFIKGRQLVESGLFGKTYLLYIRTKKIYGKSAR